jgi:hypothetical protein
MFLGNVLRRRVRAVLVCASLMWLSASASVSWAGTLCGTVRDALTQSPVARAGVFLRTTQGAYTGLHSATAIDGTFCLNDVPAGTYDIEVKVDDYLVSYLRGVQVSDTVTGVELPVQMPSIRLRLPCPNPAQGLVKLTFALRDGGPTRLTVHDVRGRLVQGWESTLGQGEHEVSWNLRSLDGGRVAAGVYVVRLNAAGQSHEQTMVVARPR